MRLVGIKVAPSILAHPEIMSGTPCIQGRRIPSATIVAYFLSGDSVAHIAENYRLEPSEVEAAIRYELERRRKRSPEMRAIRRKDRAVLVTDKEAQKIWRESL